MSGQSRLFEEPIEPCFFTLGSALKRGLVFLLLGLSFLVAAILLSVFAEAGTSYPTHGRMTEFRTDHTATLLSDGRVLLTGGTKVTSTPPHFDILNTAEIYDPTTGDFTRTTGIMTTSRRYHSAVLLADGRVLITGGEGGGTSYLFSAEIYDPTTDTFTPTGAMNAGRQGHTSTLLPNGWVLITRAGICDDCGPDWNRAAELWDSATHVFHRLILPYGTSDRHDALLLPHTNEVLIGNNVGDLFFGSVYLYNYSSRTIRQFTIPFGVGVSYARAALLPDGRVFLGGIIFDPATETFSPIAGAGIAGEIIGLSNGEIMGLAQYVGSYYAYQVNPVTGSSAKNALLTPRSGATITRLTDERILIAGGWPVPYLAETPPPFESAEIYDSLQTPWVVTHATSPIPFSGTTTKLLDGRYLITGQNSGMGTSSISGSASLFDPIKGVFTPIGNLRYPRSHHTATLLENGKVLIAGGCQFNLSISFLFCSTAIPQTEIYDPATGMFTVGPNLQAPRLDHSATLLNTGQVLIVGGFSHAAPYPLGIRSTELYDPDLDVSGRIIRIAGSTQRHGKHTATKLLDGRVLVIDGAPVPLDPPAPGRRTSSTEIFNPVTGMWTAVSGELSVRRNSHTATLLTNGEVLVTGGKETISNMLTPRAEIFNPNTGRFRTVGDLLRPRTGHTATVVADGSVWVVGGETTDDYWTYRRDDWFRTSIVERYNPSSGTFSFHSVTARARDAFNFAFPLGSGLALIGREIVYEPLTGSGGAHVGGPASFEVFMP